MEKGLYPVQIHRQDGTPSARNNLHQTQFHNPEDVILPADPVQPSDPHESDIDENVNDNPDDEFVDIQDGPPAPLPVADYHLLSPIGSYFGLSICPRALMP